MSSLFQEIIFDILLRLPVKTLLRIRCVSKSLCNIIDSLDFIHAHLSTSAKTRKKLILLRWKFDETAEFYAADHSDRLKDSIKLKNPIKLSRYYDPSETDPMARFLLYADRIVGSCNGLILLMQNPEKLLLWNPFTNKYKMLPEPQDTIFTRRPQNSRSEAFGLCYDAASNDYKVVKIQFLGRKECGVGIYSLRSNSWRRLKDFPCDHLIIPWTGKHVNGTLYWRCFTHITYSQREDKKIVAFDVSTETFHTTQIPSQCAMGYNSLHNLDGQLWFISRLPVDFDITKTKNIFYVVEKHEATLTWSKVGSATYMKVGQNFSFSNPCSHLKEGSKLLPDELTNFDGFYDMGTGDKICISDSTICWESLVSVGNE